MFWKGWWGGWFCLVYVSSFFLGGLNLPSLTTDASWQAVLEYAVLHHFQFGRDIVFTYGPLGFLETQFSQGHLIAARAIFALFWSGVVALSATGMARRMPGLSGYILLAWLAIQATSREFDQIAYFTMAYGTAVTLDDERSKRWQVPVFFLSSLVLSLVKFTFFLLGVASLGIVIGVGFLEKRIWQGLALAASAVIGFVVGWAALGQRITDVPSWIAKSWDLASGYSGAMSLSPANTALATAVAALLLFVLALVLIVRKVRLRPSRLAILLTVAVYVFMTWKEGFVRADTHIFIFILFLPLAVSFCFLRVFWEWLNARSQLVLIGMYSGIVLLCIGTAHSQYPNSVIQPLEDWPARVEDNMKAVSDLVRGRAPALFAARRDAKLIREPQLSRAKAVIGNGTVDVINFYQWAALANQMNYHPRPIIQGYSAYTADLQNFDAAFFRGPTRPQFILLSQQAIDGRFPTLEDSAALNYVLANYTPIVRDGDFLVLRQASAKDLSFQLVDGQTLRFGEKLNVSRWAGQPLFMSVSMQPTLLGRVVGFAYQETPVYVRIFRGADQMRYRFVPEMAELPFLLSPVLDSNRDVVNLYVGISWRAVDSVIFERPLHWSGEHQSTFNVRLYTSPGWRVSSSEQLTPRMVADLEGLPFWPRPLSIKSVLPHQVVDFFGAPGMFVHAPGKVVLAIPKSARTFSGSFGILPGAYTGGGKTDGVEFSIDVKDGRSRTRRLFDRLVRPLTQPSDRGRLSFHIRVDGGPGKELILSTGIAPKSGGNWDWSVWSDCRFGGDKTR